jgi:hypothetical protein
MDRTVSVRHDTLTESNAQSESGFTDVSKITVVMQLLSRRREISSHKFRKEKEVQLLLYGFDQTCIWPIAVSEHSQFNCTKIRPVGAQLLHMDRQTDMTRLLTVAFRSCLAKASKRNTRYCRWLLCMTIQCERLNSRMWCLFRYRWLQLKAAGQSRFSLYLFIKTCSYLNFIGIWYVRSEAICIWLFPFQLRWIILEIAAGHFCLNFPMKYTGVVLCSVRYEVRSFVFSSLWSA